jgi:hypothetical protein
MNTIPIVALLLFMTIVLWYSYKRVSSRVFALLFIQAMSIIGILLALKYSGLCDDSIKKETYHMGITGHTGPSGPPVPPFPHPNHDHKHPKHPEHHYPGKGDDFVKCRCTSMGLGSYCMTSKEIEDIYYNDPIYG